MNQIIKAKLCSDETLYLPSNKPVQEVGFKIMCSDNKKLKSNNKKQNPFLKSKSSAQLLNDSKPTENKQFNKSKSYSSIQDSIQNSQNNSNKKYFKMFKRFGINLKDFMILTYRKAKRETLPKKRLRNAVDSDILKAEEVLAAKRSYAVMNRRFTRESIRYKTLDVIEEGEEPDVELKFGRQHFYPVFEGHRSSNTELEIMLQRITRMKEKMVLNSHHKVMTSAISVHEDKATTKRKKGQRKGFFHLTNS